MDNSKQQDCTEKKATSEKVALTTIQNNSIIDEKNISDDDSSENPSENIYTDEQPEQNHSNHTTENVNTINKENNENSTLKTTNFDQLYLNIINAIKEGFSNSDNKLGDIHNQIYSLNNTIQNTSEKISYLPRQIRMMNNKIGGLNSSISESRVKSLLHSILSIYDLLNQILKSLSKNSIEQIDHKRNYEVLLTQLSQTLMDNGLTEILAIDSFDPTLHRAVESKPCDDPEKDNKILEVVRPGFKTEQSTLRYSEVIIYKYIQEKKIDSNNNTDNM